MSAPSTVQIKRKRSQDGDLPRVLYMEPPPPKSLKSHHGETSRVRYELQENADIRSVSTDGQAINLGDGNQTLAPITQASDQTLRTFEFAATEPGAKQIPTFVETGRKRKRADTTTTQQPQQPVNRVVSRPIKPFKRPGRGAAAVDNIPTSYATAETQAQRNSMQKLANKLDDIAMDEVKVTKPKVKPPTISAERYRAIHRQRVASQQSANHDKDVDMDQDSEADYVYDTYTLASSAPEASTDPALAFGHSIGYLIINLQDQEAWDSLVDDSPSDREGHTDDEDSNAEDYYGADYPEDELSSDDEFDRNPYVYRANDEEYDENTGASSDEEEEEQRMMNPWWSTAARFARSTADTTASVADDTTASSADD